MRHITTIIDDLEIGDFYANDAEFRVDMRLSDDAPHSLQIGIVAVKFGRTWLSRSELVTAMGEEAVAARENAMAEAQTDNGAVADIASATSQGRWH